MGGVTAPAVWALTALWAASSLWYPFGWDQGILSWVGETILRGGMPYRDAFDLKGPAAYSIFALAQAVFGHNQWGIRLLDLLGIAAAAFLVARLVGRYTGRRVGHWAAAVLILWYGGLTFWHTAQPDGFAAMLLCVGFAPLLTSEEAPGTVRALAAGLAVGLTVAMKPTYGMFLLVPAVVFLGSDRHRLGRAVVRLAATSVAAALVVGAFLGWFAVRGALDDLLEVHVAFNASIYSSGDSLSIGDRLRGLVEYVLAGNVFVVVLPLAVVGAISLARRRPVAAAALVTWAALAVFNVVFQNKFFAYQWAPLFPPTIVLGAVGLSAALRGDEGTGGAPNGSRAAGAPGWLGVALFYTVLVHASVHPAFEVLNWATYVGGLRDKAEYYDTFGVPGDDLRMTEHIRATSDPGDRLFVMAWNTEILFSSGLETVSRFGFSLPFWMGEGSEFQARYRREVMADLRARPPELIVVAPQAEPLVGRVARLEEFPEFNDFLQGKYGREVSYGDLILYRLSRGGGPG